MILVVWLDRLLAALTAPGVWLALAVGVLVGWFLG